MTQVYGLGDSSSLATLAEVWRASKAEQLPPSLLSRYKARVHCYLHPAPLASTGGEMPAMRLYMIILF